MMFAYAICCKTNTLKRVKHTSKCTFMRLLLRESIMLFQYMSLQIIFNLIWHSKSPLTLLCLILVGRLAIWTEWKPWSTCWPIPGMKPSPTPVVYWPTWPRRRDCALRPRAKGWSQLYWNPWNHSKWYQCEFENFHQFGPQCQMVNLAWKHLKTQVIPL